MKKNFLYAFLIVLFTGVFCFISLYVFIFSKGVTFNNAGQAGDAFAGLTAPIINLASVVLIFLSFKMQFDANKIQKDALENEIKRSNTLKELDQILGLIDDLKHQISQLKISLTEFEGRNYNLTPKVLFESEAIKNAHHIKDESEYQKFYYDYYLILNLMLFIFDKTESYGFDFRDKRVIYEKIKTVFTPSIYSEMDLFILVDDRFMENKSVYHCRSFIKEGHIKVDNLLFKYIEQTAKEIIKDSNEKLKNNDPVRV